MSRTPTVGSQDWYFSVCAMCYGHFSDTNPAYSKIEHDPDCITEYTKDLYLCERCAKHVPHEERIDTDE